MQPVKGIRFVRCTEADIEVLRTGGYIRFIGQTGRSCPVKYNGLWTTGKRLSH